MSLSVIYWRLPEEEADLLARLQKDPGIVSTPNSLVASADHIVWKPPAETFAGGEDSVLITLPELVPLARSAPPPHHHGPGSSKTRPSQSFAYESLVEMPPP